MVELALRPVPVVCVIIGVLLSIALLIDSMLVVALYAYSTAGASYTCTVGGVSQSGSNATISDRTAGLGLSSGGLALLVSVGFLIAWLATLVLDVLNHGPPNWVLGVVLLCFSLLIIAALLVAWALLAKDIDEWQSQPPGTVCDTPGGWGAALAFALFGFCGWIGMAILIVTWVLLLYFVDRPSLEG